MAYILSGVTIRAPYEIKETNNTQMAVQRALSGALSKDLFGSNKRVWQLSFVNCKPADFSVIDAIYQAYLANNATVPWQITEPAYTVAQTSVHISRDDRGFSVRGSSYISDFTIRLEEA